MKRWKINFKKISEVQKQKLEQVEQKQKSQSAVDQGGISSLGLFKKEFKISGVITDTSSPDQLSFTGLIRQINTDISNGYKPEEICEGVIRSIQPGSLLGSYLNTMSITDLTLPRLTLRAPRGGGVENDPPLGFSSVVFARGMILKRNFG